MMTKLEQGKQHPKNQQGIIGRLTWAKGYARRYEMPDVPYEKGAELHYLDTDLGTRGVVPWLLGWKCAGDELGMAAEVMP